MEIIIALAVALAASALGVHAYRRHLQEQNNLVKMTPKEREQDWWDQQW